MTTLGIIIAVIGIATEGVGAAAMAFYPIRRRLPSPFLFFSLGFIIFVVGLVLAAVGQAIVPAGR